MDIVLFGIQGSGKGTLGRAVAEKFNYEYFETGGQLRILAQENSALGQKVKTIIEAGHLVPADVVMDIVEDFVKKNPAPKKIIFDGIPRSAAQAESFNQLLEKHQRSFIGILVDIPEETALKRLTSRRICSKCKTIFPGDYSPNQCEKCQGDLMTRTDDNPESIRIRFQTYREETLPVIEQYKKEEKIVMLDGTPAIPQARTSIFQLIEEKILNT